MRGTARRLMVIVMAICAGALAVAAASAAASSTAAAADPPAITIGADGETAPVFSYANAIRERVSIPVPGVDQDGDGITDQMSIDIVRPAETNSGLKVPAIIDPSPYYTSLGRGNETEYIHTTPDGVLDKFPLFYDNYFVPRGYAFIAADAIGTGFSTGCPLHGGPGDVAGFKAVIDWLMGRTPGYDKNGNPVTASWDNGKNAMIGKSYDGTFANGTASTGVDGLTTIVPISAISDWYDYSRMGGIRFNTHYPASLSNSITQNVTATQLGVVPPNRNTLCLGSRNAMSAIDGDPDGDINQFWQDRNYNLNVGNVHAAVLESQGLNDDNVRPNHFGQWWAGLTANNVPRKLWLSQEGHVDPFDYRRAAWVDTLHRWFDYWLQGVQNGIMSEPQVDIETAPNTWETQASWPLPGTKPIDVFLRGTAAGAAGNLGLSTGGNTDSLTFTDANLSETNYLSLTNSQANKLMFLSSPLTHDLRISGTPIVDIMASLSKTQSNLSAFLVDYGGGVVHVNRTSNEGVQNATTSSCYGDSTPTDDGCYLDVTERTTTPALWRVSKGILDSTNRDSLFTGLGSPAVIGTKYEFKWPTLPNDYTFPAGHQIGIVIGANFSGYGSVNGTTATAITVDTRASKIILPIVGGHTAAFASGAFAADTTAPTLHLPADSSTEATGPATTVTYTATVTDNEDPNPTISCTPASGSGFAVGTTTVNCTGTDETGNTATGSFHVTVTDTTAPSISPGVDASAEATGPLTQVSYALPTASDLVDGAITPVCTPAPGALFPLGPTLVTCTATDAHGNASHTTLTVTVHDTTAPSLTVPVSVVVDGTTPTGGRASWTATATDLVDPSPTVTCVPASGSFFATGDTLVTCTATDASGNSSSKSFNVHVNGVPEEFDNLTAVVQSLGLDTGLTTRLLTWLSTAQRHLDRQKDACQQLDGFLLQVLAQAGKVNPTLTVAQAKALAAAANALEGSIGCLSPTSPAPAAEQGLLGLLGTIEGFNLNPGVENPLTNQVRETNKNVVNGSGACSSLTDLTAQIGDLAGKHKLTAAQAAQLLSAVASIRGTLGCDGGGQL
jgi:X-Pro dipeptidyl-peptidase